jgi:hypothetical protein
VLPDRHFGDRTVFQGARRSKKHRQFSFGSAQSIAICNTSVDQHQQHRYPLQTFNGEVTFSQRVQGGEERAVFPGGRPTGIFSRRIVSGSEIRDQTIRVDATDQRLPRRQTTPSSPTCHRKPGGGRPLSASWRSGVSSGGPTCISGNHHYTR